ncbi:MAG TPA: DNA-processing protein DprA [Methylophilaceae bacterium]|nr:DNA-processing protein DprA [Methylophilaceae bacterium]
MENPDSSTPEEAALWIGLSLLDGLGAQSYRALLSHFGTPENIYATSRSELRKVVSDAIAQQISEGLNAESVAPALAWLERPGNHLVTLADAHYPRVLLEIPDPPPLLYCKGRVELLNTPTIAVVGSRNATLQGEKTAEAFSQALSESGYCIVSGMALGIDGAAHRGALQGRGSTIAAVGTGLDIVYPAKHRQLAHEIAEKGLIISEFPLGTPSMAQNFPRRNRIISGLARGCLVVEANLQSGSLITARLAAEQGREVFAIPGSIHSPVAKGCHQLIKQGAKLVDSIHDILEELGGMPLLEITKDAKPAPPEDPLLEKMGYDPVTMDGLIERSGLTSESLSSMLLVLELEGKVASLPGGRYQRLA